MKFQPGDRVVFAGDNSDLTHSHSFNMRATVVRRSKHGEGVEVIYDGDKDPEIGWFYDRRFVLESVYDSPLMKAIS